MGKVHVVGVLGSLLSAARNCEYQTFDVGPALGGAHGGPWVSTSALENAVVSSPGMTLLLRDNGANIEVCSTDGETVFATVPTV